MSVEHPEGINRPVFDLPTPTVGRVAHAIPHSPVTAVTAEADESRAAPVSAWRPEGPVTRVVGTAAAAAVRATHESGESSPEDAPLPESTAEPSTQSHDEHVTEEPPEPPRADSPQLPPPPTDPPKETGGSGDPGGDGESSEPDPHTTPDAHAPAAPDQPNEQPAADSDTADETASHEYEAQKARAVAVTEAMDPLTREYMQTHGGDTVVFRDEHGIYSATRPEDIASYLSAAGLQPGQKHVDIGSGDGRVNQIAAAAFGAESTGYESSPDRHELAVQARAHLVESGTISPEDADRVHLAQGDFLDPEHDISDVDVFTYFEGSGIHLEAVAQRLDADAKEGALLVVYAAGITGQRQVQLELTGITTTDTRLPVRVYRVNRTDEDIEIPAEDDGSPEGAADQAPNAIPRPEVPYEDPALQEVLGQGQEYEALVSEIDRLFEQEVEPEAIVEQLGIEGLRYVTKGGKSYVYELPDGKILKLPRVSAADERFYGDDLGADMPPYTSAEVYQKMVEPLLRCKGEPGFEQIVGAKLEGKGYIVCERMEGTRVQDTTPQAVDELSLEDAGILMDRCKTAERLRLHLDSDATNLFIGGPDRIGIIDINTVEEMARLEHDELSAAEVARFYAAPATGLLLHMDDGWMTAVESPLPPIGETFYRAYLAAFGPDEADKLLADWRDYGIHFTPPQPS